MSATSTTESLNSHRKRRQDRRKNGQLIPCGLQAGNVAVFIVVTPPGAKLNVSGKSLKSNSQLSFVDKIFSRSSVVAAVISLRTTSGSSAGMGGLSMAAVGSSQKGERSDNAVVTRPSLVLLSDSNHVSTGYPSSHSSDALSRQRIPDLAETRGPNSLKVVDAKHQDLSRATEPAVE